MTSSSWLPFTTQCHLAVFDAVWWHILAHILTKYIEQGPKVNKGKYKKPEGNLWHTDHTIVAQEFSSQF